MGLKVDLKIQLLVINTQVRNEARMQHLQAPGGHIFPDAMSWVPSRRFRSVRRSRHYRPGQFLLGRVAFSLRWSAKAQIDKPKIKKVQLPCYVTQSSQMRPWTAILDRLPPRH